MYAYTQNNPVMYSDISGYAPEWVNKMLIATAVVAAVAVIAVITVASCGTASFAAAVAIGALQGATIGYASGAAIGAGVGYLATGTVGGALNGMADGALSGAISGAITGGVVGGFKYLKATRLMNSTNPNNLHPAYDCSEIADDLYNLAGNKGSILTFRGNGSGMLRVMEYGNVDEYAYHSVYKYGRYMIDPRYGQLATKGQYVSMLRGLNPLGILF